MDRSLSYYAVRQGKAAFGLEASKEFPVEVRAYYHLLMVESFLAQAGVEFTRGFALTPEGVREALLDKLDVTFADNKVFLPLEDVRPAINLLPLSKDAPAQAVTSKPIMGCGICRHSCAAGAINISPLPDRKGFTITIWQNSCCLCASCRHYCPTGAMLALAYAANNLAARKRYPLFWW